VEVEARLRIRTDRDPGRVCRLLDHAAPGRVALDHTQDGVAIGLGEASERRENALDHRIVRGLGGELARGGEEGVQGLE
jgi:hypothetical protein